MKAVLLHGTDDTHASNWLPWLERRLSSAGWEVYNPDLPQAAKPSLKRYTEFFRQDLPWKLDRETVVVGHSSGAIAALGLLQDNPVAPVSLCVLVGALKNGLGWTSLDELFSITLDFPGLRKKATRFVLFHSDTDPYCPLDHAEHLAEQLNGELRVEPNQGHFSLSTNPSYDKFPALLELVTESRE